MNESTRRSPSSILAALVAAVLVVLAVGCNSGGPSFPDFVNGAPTVLSTVPADGAVGVPTSQTLTAIFSEAMDPATITAASFTLRGPGATPVAGTVTYDEATARASFNPTSALAAGSVFTATITTAATDTGGRGLPAMVSWSFTTAGAADSVAPTVLSTTPSDGATNVPRNQVILATFSEAMNSSTITTAAFTVRGPGATLVAGTVAYDAATRVASFNPASPLPASTLITATITTAARDLAGNGLAMNEVWTFTTGAAADGVAPTVLSTTPANGASGVSVSQTISATFSEAMNVATITAATFSVTGPGAVPIAGAISYDPATRVASFNPTAALPAGTTITASIMTGAQDLAGNGLATNKVWTFTTGSAVDTVAPTVLSTIPQDGATGVATNQMLTATFSEAMNPATINGTTFTVRGPGATPVAGSVAYDVATRVASFTAAGGLASGTTFTATITTGVRDLAGNALAANETWSFVTGLAADSIAPTVISTSPANGATGVPTTQVVRATFSEPMNASTITTTTFRLAGPGVTPVSGTVSHDGVSHVASFTPTSPLAASTTYTATITTGAEDLAGNGLSTNKVWSFTTGVAGDAVAPTVVSTIPVNGATGVPTNQIVSATFSEAMNAATINVASFTLTGPGATPVSGAVSYAPASRVASFTPTLPLAVSTTFTATITTMVQDVAGNALATNRVWTFTTGAVADTVRPTVLSTVPLNGATGVPASQVVTATFSEAMNAATISSATFTLAGPGATPVAGMVTYNAATHVASFTPNAPLASVTTFTATISTAAQDLAGNSLATNKVWTFTTQPTPGNQAPVPLGAAGSFAVLAGSTVTNTGPTAITGDLGVSPGTAVTGFPPGTLTGTIHAGDPEAAAAKAALTTAYNDAAGRTLGPITVSGNLGGQTLPPGLYKSTSSLAISSGNLTLDAQGDSSAVFIFQMASTLTTTSGRAVILSGGAQAENVYWQVGTSATLGSGSQFKGNILADQSITMNTGATLVGRALTRIGAVALDTNAITVP